jgi:putative aldouronate transport system permease protein
MFISSVVVLWPLWFVVTASFSDPDAVYRGENILWFVGFQTEGYRRIFTDGAVFQGYLNSIVYSVFGAIAGVSMVLPFAFAVSRKSFSARKFLTIMLLVTMYFRGGIIPLFIIVKNLGLYNTRFIITILGTFGAWNVFIARTYFFSTIPDELWEAHLIDGGNYFQYFFLIVLPLSGAIIAVLLLFIGVLQWNDFFKSLIFLRDNTRWPLQLVLRDVLARIEVSEMEMLLDVESDIERARIANVVKYGLIVVATLPVLIIYPFLQKYIVRGVMLGAIKG